MPIRSLTSAGAMLLLFLLISCSSSGPTGPDFSGRVIVAFGNSITAGTGDANLGGPQGYPLRLEQLLLARFSDVIVLSRGVPGERTFQGLRRINTVLSHDNPHYILILEGVNDIENAGTSWVETIIDNLEKMVQTVKAAGATPVIASILPTYGPRAFKNKAIDIVNPLIRDLAERENIVFVDLHTLFIEQPEPAALFGSDGLHPTAEGYDLMANAWYKGLRRRL